MDLFSTRSRKRPKGVSKSGRSHTIVIEDGETSTSPQRNLISRAKSFLQKFDRKSSLAEDMKALENQKFMRKVSMDDSRSSQRALRVSPRRLLSSDRRMPTDTVRTAVSDYTDAGSSSRSVRGGVSKLDWWFPAKAAFGRKRDVAVEELFNRLTRPSMASSEKHYESLLIRDSVDVDKIETNQTKWIDRGQGYFHKQRKKNKQAALVETGIHAGRSLVQLAGIRNMTWHRLRHDAFSSLISMHFSRMILLVVAFYLFVWFLFGFVWWSAYTMEPDCFINTAGFLDALVMSISTANTIGYGVRAIRGNLGGEAKCMYSIGVLSVQRLVVIIMDALLVGILFSKLSQPKKRSRTIFISDSAVVCQRDGILKFQFRVGDARQTTIIRPMIQAYMHTFNPSRRRRTLEGEFIPNRVAPLKLEVMDESLLLPILVSHVIDETSPLYGMTKAEMEELKTEIVVTFVAVNSETGSEFSARQSYLSSEVFFGFQFCKIIKTMVSDSHKFHAIDLAKFHDIEPQKLWSNVFMTQNEISKVLMNSIGNSMTVPVPVLGDNTLVISGGASLITKNGQLKLSFRVGDVFPPLGQFLEAQVFAYYYPWKFHQTSEGTTLDYSCQELALGTDANPASNKLFLRMPVLVEHSIDMSSPLAGWMTRDGFIADSGGEILVIVYGKNQMNQSTERVQRTYRVADGHIKCGYTFAEIVSPPSENADGKPKVSYDNFHDMEKCAPPVNKNEAGTGWVYNFEPFMARDESADFMQSEFGTTFDNEPISEREATRKFKKTLGAPDSPKFTKLSEYFPGAPLRQSQERNVRRSLEGRLSTDADTD
ncbi:inward rectifier potassium channel protein [Chloropicon primus]|uniref:Inward rectifier potassium channel protein n=1 Tax=Chloropicon primus TaxID=1764295 RepID=A0A5B8MZP9_9CHLO|nr:inward rectifier potassium channel protein [Chloropicon primus]UPR04357.1 inward rectifier potassium channel protein [Chloropicon primus]|mmetsp:Transcript_3062/g.8352  ORF Transcript_3062/g.8352 Transcript_3062/m.8352 type:complete len:822 (-) Transcript_3062:969-3434(-)|eukprot:QDZ25152.1 inward rectifier potassium channel protein [Chloropicon primus]